MKEKTETVSNWYALKVFYNRLAEIERLLGEAGLETFVPMEKRTVVDKDGRKRSVERPLVASLMFFRSSAADATKAGKILYQKAMIYHKPNGNIPAPIPDAEMDIFRLVTSNCDQPLEYLGADTDRYSVGQQVRVIAGPLAGAVGHVCRIRGDRRLVVSISGVCAVATSYLPAAMLCPIV